MRKEGKVKDSRKRGRKGGSVEQLRPFQISKASKVPGD